MFHLYSMVSIVPVGSEVAIREIDPLQEHAAKLGNSGSDDCPAVDHGSLLANKETYVHVRRNGTNLKVKVHPFSDTFLTSCHTKEDSHCLGDQCRYPSNVGNLMYVCKCAGTML